MRLGRVALIGVGTVPIVVVVVLLALDGFEAALAVIAVLQSALLVLGLWLLSRIERKNDDDAAMMADILRDLADGRESAIGRLETSIEDRQTRHAIWQLNQVEALVQLYGGAIDVDTRPTPMPLSGGWAMDPANIVAMLDLIQRRRPEVVVEIGSGTSTAWTARLLRRMGTGRVIAIDHDAYFADATRAVIDRLGLSASVDIRVVDLVPAGIQDHETPWYDITTLSDITTIDVLVVDGPPQRTGPLARYPALPLLYERLSDNALVIMDDASRDDERSILRRWVDEFPAMREERAVPATALGVLRKAGDGKEH